MTRKIDELGRIGIPKAAREALKLLPGTAFSITWDIKKEQIVLEKLEHTCAICGTTTELVEKNEIVLCKNCMDKICNNK